MAMTYEEIAKACEGLTSVTITHKDKNSGKLIPKEYIVVPQRVKAFRKLYPQGFITTELLSNENGVCVMRASAGYYEDGKPVVLGTGLAFERQDASFINKTSYIENCETSAIGRVLGFLGIGIDSSIASAEEMVNALTNQGQPEAEQPLTPLPGSMPPPGSTAQPGSSSPPVSASPAGPVQVADALPTQTPPASPTPPPPRPAAPLYDPSTPGGYLMNEKLKLEKEIVGFNFKEVRDKLIASGRVEKVASATMTLAQAKDLMAAIWAYYREKAG